jgi:DNA-binding response OmpR family regulator
MTYCENCELLRHQLAELRMEPTLDDLQALKSAFNLSMGQATLVMALYTAGGKAVTNNRLFALRRASHNNEAGIELLKVYACHIRRRLGKDALETIWGRGYRLTDIGIETVSNALGRNDHEEL